MLSYVLEFVCKSKNGECGEIVVCWISIGL